MKPLIALAVAVPLLAACGTSGASSGAGTQVVAAFYPLQYVAERVAGEHAQVENLTNAGGEPHDLELTIQQTAELAEADVIFYQQGFQPAVDEAIEQNAEGRVVNTVDTVTLESHPETGDEHAEEDGHEHGDAHEGGDPHVWLDPERLAKIATAFTEELSAADPDHAADYAANLEALLADLETLHQDYATGLSDCAIDTVVVSHEAFGYLEKYGLHFEAIAGLSPGSEPSPAHIGELHDLIEAEGITTVFSETLVSPELAQTIAGDLDIDAGVLDPIEGLSDETANEDYLSLMRANLAALREANTCR